MGKIGLLATAAATLACVIVGVALAANTYTVTTASVSPTKAGTSTKPKPETITFGLTVASTDGNRPTLTTDYVIAFGKQIKSPTGQLLQGQQDLLCRQGRLFQRRLAERAPAAPRPALGP